MRWQHAGIGEQPGEAARRAAVLAKIDAWWRAFEGRTGDLESLFKQKSNWDLPGWMDENLHVIHEKIMWEYGPAVRGEGHRLVLTPESARELRPLVSTILGRAPAIPGWEFYDARLPEDLDGAKSTVEARTGQDIGDYVVRASIGDHRRVDLCYSSPSIRDEDDDSAFGAAFVATETLLGERCLDRWIGKIEVRPLPRSKREGPRTGLTLDRLKETVDAAVGSILDQLPAVPHHRWAGEAEWSLWKLKPEPADDFADQADLYVGKSANPAMWLAAHSDAFFYSERFSRVGETFCHVKIDGSGGLSDSSFADKSEVEDALDGVLIPRGLGCQVGGGMGLRYAYIDLALVDVAAAIPVIRERLRSGRIPERSWLLFFDADLAAEWVGIYDDTPPPPGFEAD